MAPWLLPALKAVLPHVGTIIEAATPVFTRRRGESTPEPMQLLQQQVTELQTAATDNAAHIRELAAQLQSTVAALEHAAAMAETNLRRVFFIASAAAVCSVVAIGVALAALSGGG
jgi:hypothetical protein